MRMSDRMSTTRVLVYLVAILSIFLLGGLAASNMARFYSIEGEQANADHIVRDYIKRTGKDAKCRVSLKPEFPKRFPDRFEQLWRKNQMIWDYSWECFAKDDRIEGVLSVFADGNTAWSGTSSKTGDMPTEEY